MSAGSVSLESAIRTCKVDVAWSNRMESDRFLNPDNLLCPVWNGRDNLGRPVCPYSFQTKYRGCNSADDRVEIENQQRPQYMQYITLDAAGIQGNFSGNQEDMQHSSEQMKNVSKITGNYGTQFSAHVLPGCAMKAFNNVDQHQDRQNQMAVQKAKSEVHKTMAGF